MGWPGIFSIQRDVMAEANVWVVVAGYNEGRVIGDVVRGLVARWPNVVVVDDGSRDNTADEAFRAGATVLSHPTNLGQGAALATGIGYALKRGADYIATFDADGQHQVGDIAKLLAALQTHGADIAIGSRFLGDAQSMPWARKVVLKMAVIFTWIVTGQRMTDAHNGLRLFSAHAARTIRITQNRMAHASEIIERIAQNKLKLVEVPVTLLYTEYSLSKGQPLSNSVNIVLELLIGRLQR